MNDAHHPSGLDICAFIASFTTLFTGWSLEQWFGLIGVLGILFTAFMQWRRDRRESEEHRAQMKLFDIKEKDKNDG